MEHRQGIRIPARMNVCLWAGDTDLGWHRTTNLGNGGLAIRGRVPGLTTNSVVRIVLETLGEGRPKLVNLKALVVYQNDSHVGLMWAGDEAGLAELTPWAERRAA